MICYGLRAVLCFDMEGGSALYGHLLTSPLPSGRGEKTEEKPHKTTKSNLWVEIKLLTKIEEKKRIISMVYIYTYIYNTYGIYSHMYNICRCRYICIGSNIDVYVFATAGPPIRNWSCCRVCPRSWRGCITASRSGSLPLEDAEEC